MPTHIGVIGLGNMGKAIAVHLASPTTTVVGFDISLEARHGVQEHCELAGSLRDAVRACPVIILSLPMSDHVEEVVLGPGGIFETATDARLIIDMSTSDPRSTRRLAADAERAGHSFVDAPVSGGPAAVAAGDLTIALGGKREDKDRARATLATIAGTVIDVGSSGSAHMAKLLNNFLCATNIAIAGDLVRLFASQGYDPTRAIDVINASSGRSAVTEINFPKWIQSGSFDSGFAMGLMTKDLVVTRSIAEATEYDSSTLVAIVNRWSADNRRLGSSADFNRVAELLD